MTSLCSEPGSGFLEAIAHQQTERPGGGVDRGDGRLGAWRGPFAANGTAIYVEDTLEHASLGRAVPVWPV